MTKSPKYNQETRQFKRFCDLLSSPADNADLEIVEASKINLEDWKKIGTTGLDAGGYGIGDGKFFLRAGNDRLYPVVGEFPILLEPECLIPSTSNRTINLKSPQYHEAYTEMQHYNAVGDRQTNDISEQRLIELMAGLKPGTPPSGKFPDPAEIWIDAQHDSLSQYQAYAFLSNIQNRRFVQLGGSGAHCIKALIAGASEAVLLTPMVGEAEFAKSLAKRYGVEERLFCVIAVGEELPFKNDSIDLIYSGGCLHHMRTELAFGEFKRVLAPTGRFACVDPWQTKLHKIGTKVLGKREVDVFCRPINPERLAPIAAFAEHSVAFNGPILRYLFLGLSKFGINLSPVRMMKITKLENAVLQPLGMRKSGGSILVTGQK